LAKLWAVEKKKKKKKKKGRSVLDQSHGQAELKVLTKNFYLKKKRKQKEKANGSNFFNRFLSGSQKYS
jgi:hypothetical protein